MGRNPCQHASCSRVCTPPKVLKVKILRLQRRRPPPTVNPGFHPAAENHKCTLLAIHAKLSADAQCQTGQGTATGSGGTRQYVFGHRFRQRSGRIRCIETAMEWVRGDNAECVAQLGEHGNGCCVRLAHNPEDQSHPKLRFRSTSTRRRGAWRIQKAKMHQICVGWVCRGFGPSAGQATVAQIGASSRFRQGTCITSNAACWSDRLIAPNGSS